MMLWTILCGLWFVQATVASVDDNKFTFKTNNSDFSIAINLTRYVITSGEKYEGTTYSGATIDIKANRKNSAEVAAAFEDGLTQVNIFATENFIALEPSELHFVIFTTLTLEFSDITYICDDFRLGQGHYDVTKNNWWIGSTNCIDMICECTNANTGKRGKVQYHSLDDSDKIYVLPNK